MTAVANIRLFGNSEVAILNTVDEGIVETFTFGIKEAKDSVEYIIKAYDLEEVVLYGAKPIITRAGRMIQEQYMNTFNKQISIIYKEH